MALVSTEYFLYTNSYQLQHSNVPDCPGSPRHCLYHHSGQYLGLLILEHFFELKRMQPGIVSNFDVVVLIG